MKDRFPAELLDEYAAALGVRPFDEEFYLPAGSAVLVEQTGPMPSSVQELSLEEAQAEF